jgi:hypothetical protein
MAGVAEPPGQAADLMKLAGEAGFVVVNLADWAAGRRPAEVMLGPDHHANALGHRLIAERLDAVLAGRPELLRGPRP